LPFAKHESFLAWNRGYSRRYRREKKAEALALLASIYHLRGPKCQALNCKEAITLRNRLELHHKRYYPDSIREGNTIGRVLECIKHPNRFSIYCKKHHLFRHSHGASFSSKIGSERRSAIADSPLRSRRPGMEKAVKQEYIDRYSKPMREREPKS